MDRDPKARRHGGLRRFGSGRSMVASPVRCSDQQIQRRSGQIHCAPGYGESFLLLQFGVSVSLSACGKVSSPDHYRVVCLPCEGLMVGS